MSNILYPPNKNPAVALYELWATLLGAQGNLSRPGKSLYPSQTDDKPNAHKWESWSSVMPKIAYGDKQTAIGIDSWDDQGRPIFCFGGWYRRRSGLHVYLEVRADGAFRLIHPHGDNHNRIERNTFLGYGVHSGKYVWHVSPSHGPNQRIDTTDFRARAPWVYEQALRDVNGPYRRTSQSWVYLVREGNDWLFRSTEPGTSHDNSLISNYALAERLYRRAEKKHYKALGQTPPTLSLRSNGAMLRNEDAVRQIAVMLDVTSPAKANDRPMIAEEATL